MDLQRRRMGQYIAGARARSGLSQSEVARRSQGHRYSFTRGFLSMLEQGRIPDAIMRWYEASRLLAVDPQRIYQLAVLPVEAWDPSAEPAGWDDAASAVREEFAAGRLDRALGLAFQMIDRASEEGSEAREAEWWVTAAIIAKNQEAWECVELFAENALRTRALPPVLEARALMLVAIKKDETDLPGLARGILATIPAGLLEQDRALAMHHAYNSGVIHRNQGELEAALDDWDVAARLARELGEEDTEARALVESGAALALLERPREAWRRLREALAPAKRVGIPVFLHVLCRAGDAHSTLGQFEEARTAYERALESAREIDQGPFMLRARLGLCELARATGNEDEWDAHRRELRLLRRTVAVDRETLRRYEFAVASVEEP